MRRLLRRLRRGPIDLHTELLREAEAARPKRISHESWSALTSGPITRSTIDASQVVPGSITADKITVGTLSSPRWT